MGDLKREVAMGDVIEGIVLGIVNGESLEVRVDEIEPPVPGRYAALEYIRVLDNSGAAGRPWPAEESAELLGAVLQDCRIRCHVESRDPSGQLIGRIEVVDHGLASSREASGGDDYIEPRSFAEDG